MLPISKAQELLRYYFGSKCKNLSTMTESLRCGHRCGHAAFCDGVNLYVWGGYYLDIGHAVIHQASNQLWVYNESMDFWRCQECSGEPPGGTSGATCAVVLPYMYLICGHRRSIGHVSTVYRLHLTTFVWERVNVVGSEISPRDKFSSWAYQDKIYCFGGYGPEPDDTELVKNGDFVQDDFGNYGNFTWNNQLVVFDPSTLEWSNPSYGNQNRDSIPLPRAAQATVLIGHTVYMFGGRHRQHRMNDFHSLDMRTLTWTPIPSNGACPVGRTWHTLSPIDDDRLFLYGGYTDDRLVLCDSWIFHLSTSSWTQISDSGTPRMWHTAVVPSSGNVLIFGGCCHDIQRDDLSKLAFSDKVIKFQLQPSRLDLLCLNTISQNLSPSQWQLLPSPLKAWLDRKDKQTAYWRSLSRREQRVLGPHVLNGHSEGGEAGDARL